MIDNWTCHVCGEDRPDLFISVESKDKSEEYGFTPGTFKENVRYCNDRESCTEGAKTHSHFTKDSAQDLAKENSKKIDDLSKNARETNLKKDKFNDMRYFYTFLIILSIAMVINPLFSVLIHEDATYFGKMLNPIGIALRVGVAVYLSWRFTNKLFPEK